MATPDPNKENLGRRIADEANKLVREGVGGKPITADSKGDKRHGAGIESVWKEAGYQGKYGLNWCGAFAVAAMVRTGAEMPAGFLQNMLSAKSSVQYAEKHGLGTVDLAKGPLAENAAARNGALAREGVIKPGDHVIFTKRGHVATVVGYDPKSGKLTTAEGNTWGADGVSKAMNKEYYLRSDVQLPRGKQDVFSKGNKPYFLRIEGKEGAAGGERKGEKPSRPETRRASEERPGTGERRPAEQRAAGRAGSDPQGDRVIKGISDAYRRGQAGSGSQPPLQEALKTSLGDNRLYVKVESELPDTQAYNDRQQFSGKFVRDLESTFGLDHWSQDHGGKFSGDLMRAIAIWQKANRLEVSGKMDKKTLESLKNRVGEPGRKGKEGPAAKDRREGDLAAGKKEAGRSETAAGASGERAAGQLSAAELGALRQATTPGGKPPELRPESQLEKKPLQGADSKPPGGPSDAGPRPDLQGRGAPGQPDAGPGGVRDAGPGGEREAGPGGARTDGGGAGRPGDGGLSGDGRSGGGRGLDAGSGSGADGRGRGDVTTGKDAGGRGDGYGQKAGDGGGSKEDGGEGGPQKLSPSELRQLNAQAAKPGAEAGPVEKQEPQKEKEAPKPSTAPSG